MKPKLAPRCRICNDGTVATCDTIMQGEKVLTCKPCRERAMFLKQMLNMDTKSETNRFRNWVIKAKEYQPCEH